MDMTETTLNSEVIYRGKILTLERQRVRLMDGRESDREIVRHNGGAAVVPVDEHGDVYLIRQFRKALDAETLEIPAGKLEQDEAPYDCAIRELKEETGLMSERVESLGAFYPSPGYTDEMLHIYLATDLRTGRQSPDPDEFLRVVRMPMTDVLDAIREGRIHDAKTVIGLLKAKDILKVE